MTLERWIIELLESIKNASKMDAGFEIKLDSEAVNAIASAYDSTEWIEIY